MQSQYSCKFMSIHIFPLLNVTSMFILLLVRMTLLWDLELIAHNATV